MLLLLCPGIAAVSDERSPLDRSAEVTSTLNPSVSDPASDTAPSASPPRTPAVFVWSVDYDEDYDAPERNTTLLIAAGALLLIVCLVGIYLYRRRDFGEGQNGEFTRAIAGDETFEFPNLGRL
jgi:hypothetical protein